MYTLTPQFRDLTEGSVLSYGHVPNLHLIKTEFTFGVTACGQSGKYLEAFGFKPLASMNNWWPAHAGENRKLTFYWRKQESKNLDEAPKRKYWELCEQWKHLSEQLASSGCGFKLVEPPVTKKEHWRFFTLVRMPIKVSPVQEKFLKLLNYRHIDTGKLASYWLNGWPVEEYTFEKEYKYFGITQNLWQERGQSWLYYEASQHKK